MTTADGANDEQPDAIVVELPDDAVRLDQLVVEDDDDADEYGDADVVEGDPGDLLLATHGLLLWLAGRVPDDLLTQTRRWLAEDNVGALARAITHVCLAAGVALPPDYVALLATLLSADDADSAVLWDIQLTDADPAPFFRFLPAGPNAEGEEATDAVDATVIDAMDAVDGARGVWRAWRMPLNDAPWPPPKRVYLVEVDEDTELPELTAALQEDLRAAGESDPQVEIFPTGADLPTYQRFAMAGGQLVWAAREAPEIQIAAVFDEADEDGPRFRPDHPRIDEDDEIERLADYLDAGIALLVTTAQMDDVLEPERTGQVGMNFRTDGTWIWTDATTYYLREHRIAPERALREHIAGANYEMTELDSVAIHRALAVLTEPSEEEPVWTPGGGSDVELPSAGSPAAI